MATPTRAMTVLAAVVGLPAVLGATATPPPGLITLDDGAVQGEITAGSRRRVGAWRGIPFAAPPVHDLRWRPPSKPAPWAGVRNGSFFRHDCLASLGAVNTPDTTSEDCLYLNVYAPVDFDRAALNPVMVWIYGGGYQLGGTRELTLVTTLH